MSMMGELSFFLGLQIIATPTGTNSKMIVEESDPLVNQTTYRGIIGSLLYLTASRPDIVYSVGMCARFQACPRDSHLKAAKRILRYLKKIRDLVLFYPAGGTFDLVVFLQMLILQVIKLTGRLPLEWLITLDHHLSLGVPRSSTLWLFQLLKQNM